MNKKSPWGLDSIDSGVKQTQKQLEAINNECKMFASVFNNKSGELILDSLKKVLNSPTWPCDKDERYGYYREGQNDIIRYILNRVERGKKI